MEQSILHEIMRIERLVFELRRSTVYALMDTGLVDLGEASYIMSGNAHHVAAERLRQVTYVHGNMPHYRAPWRYGGGHGP